MTKKTYRKVQYLVIRTCDDDVKAREIFSCMYQHIRSYDAEITDGDMLLHY